VQKYTNITELPNFLTTFFQTKQQQNSIKNTQNTFKQRIKPHKKKSELFRQMQRKLQNLTTKSEFTTLNGSASTQKERTIYIADENASTPHKNVQGFP
jgi:serine/threonine-protein kinase RIO1